jgi:hypothetical protein
VTRIPHGAMLLCRFLVQKGYHVVGIMRNTRGEGAKGVCISLFSAILGV